MKKHFLLLLFLPLLSAKVKAQVTFSGTVYNAPAQKVYLVNTYQKRVDSATIDTAHPNFTLKADINEETFFTILFTKRGFGMLDQFAVRPGEKVIFSYDVEKADVDINHIWIDVSGSPGTLERITAFRLIRDEAAKAGVFEKQIELIEKNTPADTMAIAAKQKQADIYRLQISAIARKVFDTTKSPLNAGQMLSFLKNSKFVTERTKDSLQAVLPVRFPGNKYILAITDNSADEQGIALNSPAPPIFLKDVNGNDVDLSRLNAKYVLIDFWASWCKPCRKESPNLLKAYAEFKSKGLEILAVSIDTNPVLWKDAIKTDTTLAFTQVIDTDGSKSKLLGAYKIISIPANFLVDKNGIVVAKNLHGDQLYNEMEKLTR